MNVDDLTKLLDPATRARWARVLEVDQSTLWRAEERKQLEGSRTKSGGAIYTKAQILEWLGLQTVNH